MSGEIPQTDKSKTPLSTPGGSMGTDPGQKGPLAHLPDPMCQRPACQPMSTWCGWCLVSPGLPNPLLFPSVTYHRWEADSYWFGYPQTHWKENAYKSILKKAGSPVEKWASDLQLDNGVRRRKTLLNQDNNWTEISRKLPSVLGRVEMLSIFIW